MKKFGDPTGNGTIILSQTTHGESASNPSDLSKQKAIDIRMNANEFYHSVCDGKVELVTAGGGGYVSVIPEGEDFRVLYVHVDRPLVSGGQTVKAGQKLGRIKNMAGSHLHLGLKNISGKAPHPNPMDYLDRNIKIRPAGKAIANEWFNGGMDVQPNWKLFNDLGYGNEPEYKAGDKLILLGNMNVRNSKLQDIGDAKKNSVCEIQSYYKMNNGYDWYLVKFVDLTCYIADTNLNTKTTRDVTKLDGSEPEPIDPCQEYKNKIIQLEKNLNEVVKENDILKTSNEGLKKTNEELIKYKEYYEKLSECLELKSVDSE